jgi:hypothetical protein
MRGWLVMTAGPRRPGSQTKTLTPAAAAWAIYKVGEPAASAGVKLDIKALRH